MYSHHKTKFTGDNGWAYKYDWKCPGLDPKYLEYRYLEHALLNFPFSAIVWKGGIRSKDNFICAVLCALDFDGGTSVDEAAELFSKYNHIIAASRNHQKDKGGVTCDRFRVVLEFERPITDVKEFEFNMAYYTRKFRSDPQAKDAARFFYPCTKILSKNDGNGDYLPVMPVPHADIRRQEQKNKKEHIKFAKNNPSKTPTNFMREFEVSGAYDQGTKHSRLLRVAHEMTLVGFDLNEIISYCSCRTSANIKEVTRVCTDGHNFIKMSLR
jgi:hypothetical protein